MGNIVITSSKFPDSLEKVAKYSFSLGIGREVYSNRDVFFSKESSDKKTETYVDLGDVGGITKHSGAVKYQSVKQNYKNTITNFLYSGGLQIEYEWIRTDQLNTVKKVVELLGLAMRRLICSQAISWFNDGLSAYTTKDTLALFSAAHTSNVGGASQSNLITSPFSSLNLTAAKIAMRKFTTNLDNEMEMLPDMLVGGVDLEDAFEVVNKSNNEGYSTSNNINVHKGKYTAVTDIRITDTNNWALIDKGLMKRLNKWYELDPISFKKTYSEDELLQKYIATTFFGNGSEGWEWVLFSNVSG